MKTRLAIFLATLMLFGVMLPVYADTVIDYVLYTDIRTYINDVEITSYNIKGNTAVVVEDLASYGFDVAWDGTARTLKVVRNAGKTVTGAAVTATSGGKVGDKAMPVYATDIKTYLDGKETESYNVGGRTIVYVDDLAKLYASDYKWDPSAKTLKAVLSGSAPAQSEPSAPAKSYDVSKAVLCYHLIDKSSVKANLGHFDNEGEENIFDNDSGTKWCTNVNDFNNGKHEVIVEWTMTEPVVLVCYKITTANDDVEWPGRIPKAWTLEAKEKKNSKWVVIDKETSASIPKKNLTDSDLFLIDEPGEYQYYRLVITGNQGGIEVYQFSELKLYAADIEEPYEPWNGKKAVELIDFLHEKGKKSDSGYYYKGVSSEYNGGRLYCTVTQYSPSMGLVVTSYLEDENEKQVYDIQLGLNYDNDGIKHVMYWDADNNEYYLDIDAREIYYSTSSFVKTYSFSNYLEDLKAYKADDTEASDEIKNSILSALRTLLTDTCEVFIYWDLDITMEDFGFTNHN